jgi:hypothetical protein
MDVIWIHLQGGFEKHLRLASSLFVALRLQKRTALKDEMTCLGNLRKRPSELGCADVDYRVQFWRPSD